MRLKLAKGENQLTPADEQRIRDARWKRERKATKLRQRSE